MTATALPCLQHSAGAGKIRSKQRQRLLHDGLMGRVAAFEHQIGPGVIRRPLLQQPRQNRAGIGCP